MTPMLKGALVVGPLDFFFFCGFPRTDLDFCACIESLTLDLMGMEKYKQVTEVKRQTTRKSEKRAENLVNCTQYQTKELNPKKVYKITRQQDDFLGKHCFGVKNKD